MSDATNDAGDQFPWEDVEASRKDVRLQCKKSIAEGQATYLQHAKACPKCAAAPTQLTWLYFCSPKWTWEDLCGRAGWMTVCDPCHVQVDFFMEMMN